MPPPVWPQFIFVPRIRKPPGLFGAQDSTVLHVTGSTPSIEMLLRPEEKHGASRKSDVVPPLVSGHRKVNDSFPTGDVAVSISNCIALPQSPHAASSTASF